MWKLISERGTAVLILCMKGVFSPTIMQRIDYDAIQAASDIDGGITRQWICKLASRQAPVGRKYASLRILGQQPLSTV